MMKTESLRRAGLAMLISLCCVGWAHGHHSTAAEFDPGKPVKFTGTVLRVVWLNPHIYTHVEVKQPGGPIVYHVEGGSPNTLFRQGWRKESLKLGEEVTVTGQGAKSPDSPNVGQATIVTADGRRIFAGDGPAKANQD